MSVAALRHIWKGHAKKLLRKLSKNGDVCMMIHTGGGVIRKTNQQLRYLLFSWYDFCVSCEAISIFFDY